MAERFDTWTGLACPDCACEEFDRVFTISVRSGGGTVDSQAGWRCAACRKKVDIATMQQAQELKEMEKEIEERRTRLQQLRPRSPTSVGS